MRFKSYDDWLEENRAIYCCRDCEKNYLDNANVCNFCGSDNIKEVLAEDLVTEYDHE